MLEKITFVTTCKARLDHVKKTLPRIMNLGEVNVIFVDYGCPQKSGDWVRLNYPSVNVINVNDDTGFCLSRARNIGAAHVATPWIFFIDADILVEPSLGLWLSKGLKFNRIYRASLVNGKLASEIYGSFICPTILFNKVGMYDEVFRGWGGEDEDIYRRLNYMRVYSDFYPSEHINPIHHDDNDRTKFYDIADKNSHHIISELYMLAKYSFSAVSSGNSSSSEKYQIPISSRLKLMQRIKDKVIEWDATGRPEIFPIVLKFSANKWLPEPYQMKIETTLQFNIHDKSR